MYLDLEDRRRAVSINVDFQAISVSDPDSQRLGDFRPKNGVRDGLRSLVGGGNGYIRGFYASEVLVDTEDELVDWLLTNGIVDPNQDVSEMVKMVSRYEGIVGAILRRNLMLPHPIAIITAEPFSLKQEMGQIAVEQPWKSEILDRIKVIPVPEWTEGIVGIASRQVYTTKEEMGLYVPQLRLQGNN